MIKLLSKTGGEGDTRLPAGTHRLLSPFSQCVQLSLPGGFLCVAALDNRASKEAASTCCPYVLEPTSEPCPCGNKGRFVFYSQWRLRADIEETDSKVSI